MPIQNFELQINFLATIAYKTQGQFMDAAILVLFCEAKQTLMCDISRSIR